MGLLIPNTLAVRTNLNHEVVPELSTECEMIWVKVKVTGPRSLYVCAYYRPKVSDNASLDKLEASINRASGIRNLIDGYFNFPCFDWPTRSLKDKPQYPTLHRNFMEMLTWVQQVVFFLNQVFLKAKNLKFKFFEILKTTPKICCKNWCI